MYEYFAVLILSGAILTYTISQSDLFFRFREALLSRSQIIGKMVACPYCFAHWIGLILSLNIGVHFCFVIIYGIIIAMIPLQYFIRNSDYE